MNLSLRRVKMNRKTQLPITIHIKDKEANQKREDQIEDYGDRTQGIATVTKNRISIILTKIASTICMTYKG